jgi:hypothetical protein
MTLKCESIVPAYLAALESGFECASSDDGWFLATPFVRPDGEGIEIELRIMPNGSISVTDMGDTLGYLYVNGLTLSKALVTSARQIAKTYGISLQRNQLGVQVEPDSIGLAVNDMIQATLSVSDLIQKRRPTPNVRFDDEVESLILHSGVTYDVGFVVTGNREQHTIKFHVNSGRNLLIQPLSAPNEAIARGQAERWAYRFSDLLGRDSDWHPVVVLDDRSSRSGAWSGPALTPVREYTIAWSNREELESWLS